MAANICHSLVAHSKYQSPDGGAQLASDILLQQTYQLQWEKQLFLFRLNVYGHLYSSITSHIDKPLARYPVNKAKLPASQLFA